MHPDQPHCNWDMHPSSCRLHTRKLNPPKEGSVLEENGNRGEHNEVGEAIVGPSHCRHIPTTGVTAMMT